MNRYLLEEEKFVENVSTENSLALVEFNRNYDKVTNLAIQLSNY